MKIVNIILTSQNGGAEQVFVDYCNVLKNKLNHDILAIIKDDAPYAYQLEDLQISIKKIKNNLSYYDFFAVNSIKKILEEFNADAVITHIGKSMVLTRKAIKKIKNKKIYQVAVNHSMNVKRSIGSDVIISINKPMFFKTIDQGQDANKSFVVHNAIDMTGICAAKSDIFLQNKDVIKLGVIGRLDNHIKGFCSAIKTIKLLKNHPSGKKFVLKIAGSGPIEKSLRDLAKSLQVEDMVEFVGWVKDKKEFFDSIDIFLLTSKRETFGLVLLEAMKFCKPIISCKADGPKEILRDKVDGLLVDLEPFDKIEYRLIEAIEKIIEDSDFANKMVEQSFVRLQEKFSFDALAARLEEIFGKKI